MMNNRRLQTMTVIVLSSAALLALIGFLMIALLLLRQASVANDLQQIRENLRQVQQAVWVFGGFLGGFVIVLAFFTLRVLFAPATKCEWMIETAEQLKMASAGMTYLSTQMVADATDTSQEVQRVASNSAQLYHHFQQVSAAAEEVTANIREISQNIQNVMDIAQRATETTNMTNATILSLESHLQAVGKINHIITDIAQQTNLLAINASLEAVRARELGRGFTVVAQEVKKLADQTTASASEIMQKISMIQTSSQDAVNAVNAVTEMTDQVSEVIQTITTSIVQQSHASEEISRAVVDAVRDSDAINQAIRDVERITQSMAERAGNVQSAALKLALLGKQQNQLVAMEKGAYQTFQIYQQQALTGRPYPGLPGKRKRLAFANNAKAYFCDQVQTGLVRQAKLAGFHDKDLILLNNQFDPAIGMRNAETILAQKPDIFIEFQADSDVNARIATRFKRARIPVLAIDIAIPHAPMVGIDNYGVAIQDGRAMGELITSKLGGLDQVDLIVLLQIPESGAIVKLRSDGVADALLAMFGEAVIPKIIRFDGGIGDSAQAEAAMQTVLAQHPQARRIALTGVTDEMVNGAITALQAAGRWNPENMVVVTLGLDELGQQLLRDGLADVGVAFFPERYGEVIIPAALTMLKGHPVPETMFVPSAVVTKTTLKKYYKV